MDCELLWSGVDYARVWLEGWEVRALGGADAVWVKALSTAGLRSERARPYRWRMGCAEGWLLSGVGVAVKEDEAAVVQVPGAAGGDLLRALGEFGRVSRIDVQVTVLPPVSRETAIRAEWEAMAAQSNAWPHRGRAPRVWAIVDEAITAYSGKRSKDGVYLRVYDADHVHGRESPAYAGSVRYELEATGARAVSYYKQIGGAEWSDDKVVTVVTGEAIRRGVKMRLNGVVPQRVKPTARLGSKSHAETLEWIRRQVKPSVQRLLEEGVSRRTVEEALGLSSAVSCADD
jgi:hypothetical protein